MAFLFAFRFCPCVRIIFVHEKWYKKQAEPAFTSAEIRHTSKSCSRRRFLRNFLYLKKTVCGFRRTRKTRIRAIENHSGQTGILFFRLIDSQLILAHAGDECQAVFLRQLNPLRGRRSLGRQNGNARANGLGNHIRRQASA